MPTLADYVKQFRSLRRATGGGFGAETLGRAPHKPFLLLAVMDLVSKGVITSPFIEISTVLVDLNDLFTGYWRTIADPGRVSSIAYPFSRLHNEPFWELVPREGHELTPGIIDRITTVTCLQRVALGAKVDEELLVCMASSESRRALRMALLESCFSEEGRPKVGERIAVNEEAFDYGAELLRRAHAGVSVTEPPGTPPREGRSLGFRRVVIRAYDNRCALCGVRIVTAEGHTAVDAAHIVPWSESRNDDIRNGMALCKLCHWAFDEGMMGVSDQYRVITSKRISQEDNFPGLLMTLDRREIVAPQDRDLWPGVSYLQAHRSRFRL